MKNQEFRSVDALEYVREGLASGTLEVREAVKFARITARRGVVGETVVTYTANGLEEKVAEVKEDEKGEADWIATKVDENGRVVVDEYGHENSWIITNAKFQKKYEVDPENTDLYRPTGGPQLFVQTIDNLQVSQWGDPAYRVEAGGYINITNLDDVYVISERDFNDTYAFTGRPVTKKLS